MIKKKTRARRRDRAARATPRTRAPGRRPRAQSRMLFMLGPTATLFFFFQAEDGIRDGHVTGVQTCALPIWPRQGLHAADRRRQPAPGAQAGGLTMTAQDEAG